MPLQRDALLRHRQLVAHHLAELLVRPQQVLLLDAQLLQQLNGQLRLLVVHERDVALLYPPRLRLGSRLPRLPVVQRQLGRQLQPLLLGVLHRRRRQRVADLSVAIGHHLQAAEHLPHLGRRPQRLVVRQGLQREQRRQRLVVRQGLQHEQRRQLLLVVLVIALPVAPL